MRNPIRLKNIRVRFLPFYLMIGLAFVWMRPTRWGFAVGLVLVVLGEALRGWGAGHLVKNDRLTVTGPYAHVRHPLYAGSLLIGSGFSIIVGGWIAAVLLAVLVPWFFLHYFPRKERIESERLVQLYGTEYEAYRGRVPALWPRLRPFNGAAADARWSVDRFSGNNELGTVLALMLGIGMFALRVLVPL